MGIPASQRLRKPSEFSEVRSLGRRVQCGPFIMQIHTELEGGQQPPKLGVVASRRVGNAVKRNRGKRLMREIFRLNRSALPTGARIVIILRAGFDRHDFSDLSARFLKACGTTQANLSQGGRT